MCHLAQGLGCFPPAVGWNQKFPGEMFTWFQDQESINKKVQSYHSEETIKSTEDRGPQVGKLRTKAVP